jgi:hypothetical protein
MAVPCTHALCSPPSPPPPPPPSSPAHAYAHTEPARSRHAARLSAHMDGGARLDALARQHNGFPTIGSSAPIRSAVCAARRRLRRQPRERPRTRRQPRRPQRSTGSQRRSRARTSVRTCLRARPRGSQRRVHLASRSSRRTTSTVRSTDWRTRVLGRCRVARLDRHPRLAQAVWRFFVCLWF